MERRKAITTAAAASLTLLAGAAGIALNSGIIGASGNGDVGQLSPVTGTVPVTVYVDDPAASPAVVSAPAVKPTSSAPQATSSASSTKDDDHDDDRKDRDEREYEGADDDD